MLFNSDPPSGVLRKYTERFIKIFLSAPQSNDGNSLSKEVDTEACVERGLSSRYTWQDMNSCAVVSLDSAKIQTEHSHMIFQILTKNVSYFLFGSS